MLKVSCKDDIRKRGKTSPLSAFCVGAEKIKGKYREVISACVQLPPLPLVYHEVWALQLLTRVFSIPLFV